MPLRPRWTSIVVTWPQRAFSAKKISDESEITEEWKEVSGRRTTSRSCYYRDSGLVQNALCDTGYTTTRFEIPILRFEIPILERLPIRAVRLRAEELEAKLRRV